MSVTCMSDLTLVNEDSSNPLVYDFYGFPAEYYQQKFVSKGDPEMLSAVKSALKGAGVGVSTEKRGLDHGVWGELATVVVVPPTKR